MADWCLYGEAVDLDGELYSSAPDIVIVNVPDDEAFSRKTFFRFLKENIGEKDLTFLNSKVISPEHKGKKKLYSQWGRFLTRLGFNQKYHMYRYRLISLDGGIPDELNKGFRAFGSGYLVRFYDWEGCNDEDQLKRDFAIRHPELMK